MINKKINNKIKIIKNKINIAKHLFDINEEQHYIRNVYITGMNFHEKFHPFIFNKPILPNKLKEFKLDNKIILPDCYKEFLIKIGNGGGSGPLGTGIYSFEESIKNNFQTDFFKKVYYAFFSDTRLKSFNKFISSILLSIPILL